MVHQDREQHIPTPTVLQSYKLGTGPINKIVVNNQFKRIAYISGSTLGQYSIRQQRILNTYHLQGSPRIIIGLDEGFFFSASNQDFNFVSYDQAQSHRLPGCVVGKGNIVAATLSRDKSLLAIATDKYKIYIYEIPNFKLVFQKTSPVICSSILFSNENNYLIVSGSADRICEVAWIQNDAPTISLMKTPGTPIHIASIGNQIICAKNGENLTAFQEYDWPEARTLPVRFAGNIQSILAHPRGKFLIGHTTDGFEALFGLDEGNGNGVFAMNVRNQKLTSLAISPSGEYVALGYLDSLVESMQFRFGASSRESHSSGSRHYEQPAPTYSMADQYRLRPSSVPIYSEVVQPECLLCGDFFKEGDYVKQCPVCEALMHSSCVTYNGGKCVRRGCTGRPK